MAISIYPVILLSLAVLMFIKLFTSSTKDDMNKKLPPSPPALPLLGHVHLLIKKPLHKALASLSDKYGPVIFLKFDSRVKVLIISCRTLAEQCFTTNDIAFFNRFRLPSFREATFNYGHIATANYGQHWRNVRQIAVTEVLSPKRLNEFSDVRVREVRDMARRLFRSWNSSAGSNGLSYFQKVDLKAKLFELSLNILMTMLAGKRFYGDNIEDLEETKQFRETVEEFFSLASATNVEDAMPFLKFLGMAKATKKLNHIAELNKEMTQKLIDEHRRVGTQEKKSRIANLLELQKDNPEKYSDRIIQIIIVSLLQAGTDTTSNTLEWAMTLLFNNPDVIKKAVAEIDAHVGNKQLIQESDMPNLPYLHCIMNEVLRLYPAGPLLVPHKSRECVSIGGYEIPARTVLLVNAYKIHRDPSLWDEPNKFMPERFKGNKAEVKKMIPFGMGRRRCPGEGLAIREFALTVGTFIQCFEWKRIGDELIDTSEGSGLTLPKAVPLEAMYRPRHVMMDVISTLSL